MKAADWPGWACRFFSALILFCIYGLWAAIAGGLVSLCLLLLFFMHSKGAQGAVA